MRLEQKVETFPDGLITVYAPGKGRTVGEKKVSLRFEDQSVGIRRFYEAGALSGNRIDWLIKVPHCKFVNRLDIVVIAEDGRQYRIERIQYKPERDVDLYELQSVQVVIEPEY